MADFQQRGTGSTPNPARERMLRILENKKNKTTGATGGRFYNFYNIPKEIKFFKPSKEEHYLDIIPYRTTVDKYVHGELIPKGSLYFERTYFKHTIGVNRRRVVCLKTYGKPCPVCEHQIELRRAGASKKEVDELKATETQLFNLLDLDEEAKGIQLWDKATFHFGQTLDREVRNQGAKHYEYLDFYTLDNGFTLKVRMVLKPYQGKDNYQTTAIDFIPRTAPYDPRILDKALNLDTILEVLSYDELKNLLFGTETPHQESEQPAEPTNEPSFRLPPKQVVQAQQEPTNFRKQVTQVAQEQVQQEPTEPETDGNPCPFGHEFGTDNGLKAECDQQCDETWPPCFEKREEIRKAEHASRGVTPKK